MFNLLRIGCGPLSAIECCDDDRGCHGCGYRYVTLQYRKITNVTTPRSDGKLLQLLVNCESSGAQKVALGEAY